MHTGGVTSIEHVFRTTKNGEKIAIFKYKSEEEANTIAQAVNGLQIGNSQIVAKIISRKTTEGRGDRQRRDVRRRGDFGRRRRFEGRRRFRGESRFIERRGFGGYRRFGERRTTTFRRRFNMGSRTSGLRFNGRRRQNTRGGRRDGRPKMSEEKKRANMDAQLSSYMNGGN